MTSIEQIMPSRMQEIVAKGLIAIGSILGVTACTEAPSQPQPEHALQAQWTVPYDPQSADKYSAGTGYFASDGLANCVKLVTEHPQIDVGPIDKGLQGNPTLTVNGKEHVVFRVGRVDGRVKADGASLPLKKHASESAPTLVDAAAAICTDATVAAELMAGSSKIKIGDKTVQELNPWFPVKDPSQINDWAAESMTKEKTDVETVAKHEKYEAVMRRVATLVLRSSDKGIVRAQTTANIHVPPTETMKVSDPNQESKSSFEIPEFAWNTWNGSGYVNGQYTGMFVKGAIETKPGEEIACYGFNDGNEKGENADARFAIFDCDGTPVNPTPRTTTPSPTQPQRTPTTHPTAPPTTPPITSSSGKQASERPAPKEVTVVVCGKNEYLGRDEVCHPNSTSAETSGSDTSTEEGKGGSGAGATNTTQAPPTSSPAATVPVAVAPTATVAKP